MSLASFFRISLFGAYILLAGRAWGAPADSAHAYPIHSDARWFPSEVSLGPQAGLQLSRIRASAQYRSLLEPVPAGDRPWISLSLGAAVSVRWRSGFSLSLSPRMQGYGLQTREDTVSFAGNPYPHTLSARTELDYNLWPLLAGYDWMRGKQRFGIQVGLYQALLAESHLDWTVDGEPYSKHPAAAASETVAGWVAAAEYGIHWGPGDWILGLEYQRAFDSALSGLDGTVRTDAIQLRLGYAWALWRRRS